MKEAIKNTLPETNLRTADFYYDLPEELIAQHPMEQRDTSRLMVLDRGEESITHRHFYDILDYLREGDVLVINDSKVIPARVYGHVEGRVEALIELLLLPLAARCLQDPIRSESCFPVAIKLRGEFLYEH